MCSWPLSSLCLHLSSGTVLLAGCQSVSYQGLYPELGDLLQRQHHRGRIWTESSTCLSTAMCTPDDCGRFAQGQAFSVEGQVGGLVEAELDNANHQKMVHQAVSEKSILELQADGRASGGTTSSNAARSPDSENNAARGNLGEWRPSDSEAAE